MENTVSRPWTLRTEWIDSPAAEPVQDVVPEAAMFAVIQALAPFPEARVAVSAALSRIAGPFGGERRDGS